jgi:hypothetical protein
MLEELLERDIIRLEREDRRRLITLSAITVSALILQYATMFNYDRVKDLFSR